jgi:hypothetical protein
VATEDDAERAVRAAMDLTSAVATLGEEAGVPDLRARTGVLEAMLEEAREVFERLRARPLLERVDGTGITSAERYTAITATGGAHL